MKKEIILNFDGRRSKVDLTLPIPISIALRPGSINPNCYWAEPVEFKTIVAGDFVGSVAMGGSVNYVQVTMTPHGNGTHTECYGHICDDREGTIDKCLTQSHFLAALITVTPQSIGGDLVVMAEDIAEKIPKSQIEALIIRTLPNMVDKKTRQYSGTNPPYLEEMATKLIKDKGIKHLLVDLPSVDKEVDGGKLAAHKAFWGFPNQIRKDCTITELIYVDNNIVDGLYLLDLQVPEMAIDACPSKPVLFALTLH